VISDEVLERGLAAAAAEFDVPDGAVDRLRAQLGPAPADVPDALPRRLVRSRRAWLVTTAAAGVALVVAAFAIGGGSPNRGGESSGSASVAAPAQASSPAPVYAGGGPGVAGAPARGTVLAPYDAKRPQGKTPSLAPGDGGDTKVVKTGEMDLQVAKGQVPHVLDRLTALATLEHGYVADSHSSEGSDPSGAVTLRVPVAAFEATVSEVRGLPVKVLSQQTSGEDVTASYVDLQARINALVATRTTYERLLAKATTIADILAVQSRITDVQTQIEQLQGQLRVLSDKADFAALTVTVDQQTAPAPVAHHESGMSKAFHRSVDRFLGGLEAIIGILGPLLLVALLVGAAVVAGRLGYRRLRRQLV
jgi:hypothetical protein